MKREDLKKLELTDDVIDQIMALHGADLEKHKTAAETAKAEVTSLKQQVTDANAQIEAFKGLDVEGVKKQADEWKQKAEQAEKDAAAQLAQLRFDHALDGALSGAKARSTKAVRAELNLQALKYNEADGSIIGLSDQLEKLKSSSSFLFEPDEKTPTITTGGNNQTVNGDVVIAAARAAAGLPVAK